MSLEPFVELYRLSGRPTLESGARLNASANYPNARPHLQSIMDGPAGRLDELIIDGEDRNESALPEVGDSVEFSIVLPANSPVRFYRSVGDLLKIARSISRGEMPAEYYITDIDYYSNDLCSIKPTALETLSRVCRLINGLSELAHYHDEKLNSGHLKLVFIRPDSAAEFKPIELETRVTEGIVEAAEDLDIRLVEELSHSSASNDPHYSAKVGVFGASLAEFIGGRRTGDAFGYLIHHWGDFVRGYHRDLSTYLSGFAFHKAKVEVAETELKIANEFSSVLNEIMGKLLGIPISLVAVAAMPQAGTVLTRFIVLVGVFVASLVAASAVANQVRQFHRVRSAKNIVMGAIEGKQDMYPDDLKNDITSLSKALQDDERRLSKWLHLFRLLSWLPFALGSAIFIHLHCGWVLEQVRRIIVQ